MKISIAIPVYDGKLPVQTAAHLFEELALARQMGDSITIRFNPNCSNVVMGRNVLAKMFLDAGEDRLFFLDSDVTWTPGAILRLCRMPVDFVGGAYRLKKDNEEYPVRWLDQPEVTGIALSDKSTLLDVGGIPGGFLSLSRDVFTKLEAGYPDRRVNHFEDDFHAYFQMPFHHGLLWGEDSYFCKEWCEIGGKIYLDPSLELTHWDFNRPYRGHIGKWLTKNRGIPRGMPLPDEPNYSARALDLKLGAQASDRRASGEITA